GGGAAGQGLPPPDPAPGRGPAGNAPVAPSARTTRPPASAAATPAAPAPSATTRARVASVRTALATASSVLTHAPASTPRTSGHMSASTERLPIPSTNVAV